MSLTPSQKWIELNINSARIAAATLLASTGFAALDVSKNSMPVVAVAELAIVE